MVEEPKGITVTRWLLDTRSLWPGTKIQNAAQEYLELVSTEEQTGILRKHYIPDARMSLGSALIKRAYIVKCTSLPWNQINFTRRPDKEYGKPCWLPPRYSNEKWPQIDFNVSHQRGLVVLVGVCTPAAAAAASAAENGPKLSSSTTTTTTITQGHEAQIAVDLVSPGERNEMATIAASDLTKFVENFDQVLSAAELFSISYSLPATGQLSLLSGETVPMSSLGRLDRTITCGDTLRLELPGGRVETFPSELLVEEKLRRFYANFALKEAMVKLGGEGLSAEWITDCEFLNVTSPARGGVPRCSLAGVWGEKITAGGHGGKDGAERDPQGLEVWLKREQLHDVLMELQAYEEEYMIATILKPASILESKGEFPPWERLSLERDILDVATS